MLLERQTASNSNNQNAFVDKSGHTYVSPALSDGSLGRASPEPDDRDRARCDPLVRDRGGERHVSNASANQYLAGGATTPVADSDARVSLRERTADVHRAVHRARVRAPDRLDGSRLLDVTARRLAFDPNRLDASRPRTAALDVPPSGRSAPRLDVRPGYASRYAARRLRNRTIRHRVLVQLTTPSVQRATRAVLRNRRLVVCVAIACLATIRDPVQLGRCVVATMPGAGSTVRRRREPALGPRIAVVPEVASSRTRAGVLRTTPAPGRRRTRRSSTMLASGIGSVETASNDRDAGPRRFAVYDVERHRRDARRRGAHVFWQMRMCWLSKT